MLQTECKAISSRISPAITYRFTLFYDDNPSSMLDLVETSVYSTLMLPHPRKLRPKILALMLNEKFGEDFSLAYEFFNEPELLEVLGCSGSNGALGRL